MWDRIAAFTLRNRGIILSIILGSTLVMGYYASKVQLAYDMQKLVPKTDPEFITYTTFKKEFGEDGNKLAIGFKSDKLFTLDVFNRFAALTKKTGEINGVKDAVSITNLVNLVRNDSLMQFQSVKIADKLPTTQSELDSLKVLIGGLKFYNNLLYNPKTNVALLVVSIKQTVLDSATRTAVIAKIKDACIDFGNQTKTELHYSGLPYIRNQYSTKVRDEILLFTVIAFVVTALLIYLFFRSFSTLLISLGFIIIGVVWCIGLTVLLDYKITILIGTLPPLLVVIGVQNTIYLINIYHEEFRRHKNQAKALSRVISKNGAAAFLINITTAVGFGAFYFTDSSILEQYGAVSFLTICAIFIFTLLGLPVVYSFLKPPSLKQTDHLENVSMKKFLDWVTFQVFNHQRRIYFWTLALLVFSSIFIYRLKPLAYMVDDIPHSDKLYTDLLFFQDNFKGVMPFEIIVESSDPNGMNSASSLQKIYTLQNKLKNFKEFSKPMSIVEMVSFANQAYHDGDPKYYRIPSNTELGNILSYVPQSDSGNNIMESMMDKDYTKARISYQMADVGSIRMREITDEVKSIASQIFTKETYDVKITGTSAIFLKGNSYLFDSLMQSSLWALLIITFTLGLLFPSIKMITLSIIPNVIPLIITAGVMGYLMVPLKPSTILVFSIAFGITVDCTIHFVSKFRSELKKKNKSLRECLSNVIDEVGVSMIYTSIALFSGFMIFAFSDFQGTVALGLLTGITILVGLFANLFLLPALILTFEKGLNPKEELKETVIDLPDQDEE